MRSTDNTVIDEFMLTGTFAKEGNVLENSSALFLGRLRRVTISPSSRLGSKTVTDVFF